MKRQGYTLIEIMIALSVFAIIATITASVMIHVFDVRSRVAAQAEQLGELQLAVSLLTHDVTQFIPHTVRTQDMHVFAAFIGSHEHMEFTRSGVANPKGVAAKSSLERVAFLCQGSQLIRRTWSPLDTVNRHVYEDRVLLSHLQACTFDYISRYHQILPDWRAYKIEENRAEEVIPSAVRVTIKSAKWEAITVLLILPVGLYAG